MIKRLKKTEKEKKVLAVMIKTYCRGNRHNPKGDGLCADCIALQEYACLRAERCPFKETKTFCSNCKVHCYGMEMRQKIQTVMRYSGPRILFRHPLMVISHIVQTIKQKF